MGIVIATFIIAAVFVGYHASQAPQIEEKGESHSIEIKPLSTSIKPSQGLVMISDQTRLL